MKPCTLRIACLCSVLTLVIAAPVPDPLPAGDNQELDVLQIPLSNGKEIDVLTLGTKDQEELIAERNKRTIGLLRELFPDITKQIDSIVNRIIAQVIRVAGPDLLRSVLSNRPTTQRPNLASDFDDDDDEDDDSNGNDFRNDNDTDNSSNINKVDSGVTAVANNGSSGSRIKIDLPTFAPDVNGSPTNSPDNVSDQESTTEISTPPTTNPTPVTAIPSSLPTTETSSTPVTTNPPSPTSTETSTTTTTTNSPILIIPPKVPTTTSSTTTTTNSPQYLVNPVATNSSVLPTSPNPQTRDVADSQLVALEGATDTQIDLSAINKQLEETIRVARQVQEAEAAAQAAAAAMQQDQQAQEKSDTDTIQLSFNNEVSPESNNGETSNINNNELPSGESPAPALDDLTLDDDTVDLDDRNKRFLTGGGGILSGNTNNNAGGNAGAAGSGNFLFDIVRLFSGSVQTQAGGATANSVSSSTDSDGDSDANRAQDGFTEGIPGPVTRLVVLANRGLANLIQDLILRVAATSEKFVNFKAKLITALI